MIRTPSIPDRPANAAATRLGLVFLDRGHPDVLQIPGGRAEPDDLRGHRGARLEALRRGRIGGGLHRHRLDHRPAGQERRQGTEQLGSAVQRTDARGAEHLVAGERGEVDVEGVEVHRLMRHRLAGVQQGQRADRPGPLHQLGHRGHRPGDVRMMAEGNEFHPLVEFKRIEVDAAVVRHAIPTQRRHRSAGRAPATGSGWRDAPARS